MSPTFWQGPVPLYLSTNLSLRFSDPTTVSGALGWTLPIQFLRSSDDNAGGGLHSAAAPEPKSLRRGVTPQQACGTMDKQYGKASHCLMT
jgi:hypothetical protein